MDVEEVYMPSLQNALTTAQQPPTRGGGMPSVKRHRDKNIISLVIKRITGCYIAVSKTLHTKHFKSL